MVSSNFISSPYSFSQAGIVLLMTFSGSPSSTASPWLRAAALSQRIFTAFSHERQNNGAPLSEPLFYSCTFAENMHPLQIAPHQYKGLGPRVLQLRASLMSMPEE